ncbi:hypothetical protein EFK50_01125 [Nocardioides marmoriginsengisoli]|uniref:Uncharacterized protein n=1 Tax=Nocardioides marmoriginsengisoli TaxID=661483 RepID=A0A3N0CS24_9ACTN|nr:hypothetical protein [Nocardioides marmoriginsengisoli]RNL66258.1 hypothetical protein EFK50_01125 [Nocardioides marmoriginsengisoli]
MKTRIDADEWYPVYSIRPDGEHEVEASPDQVDRWKRTFDEFTRAQGELAALYEAAQQVARERAEQKRKDREAAEQEERRRIAREREAEAATRNAALAAMWDRINATNGVVYDAKGNPIGTVINSNHGVRLEPNS